MSTITTNRHYKKITLRAVLVLILLAIQPLLWQTVSQAAGRLHDKQSEREHIAEIAARIERIEQARAATQEQLSQLETVIPPSVRLPQIIERVERLAADAAVELTVRDIIETPLKPDMDPLPFTPVRVTVEVKGSPATLLAFLDAVEHLPELTFIEGWSIITLTPSAPPAPSPGVAALSTFTLTAHIVFFVQTPHAQ